MLADSIVPKDSGIWRQLMPKPNEEKLAASPAVWKPSQGTKALYTDNFHIPKLRCLTKPTDLCRLYFHSLLENLIV